jgi:hypothetical protein
MADLHGERRFGRRVTVDCLPLLGRLALAVPVRIILCFVYLTGGVLGRASVEFLSCGTGVSRCGFDLDGVGRCIDMVIGFGGLVGAAVRLLGRTLRLGRRPLRFGRGRFGRAWFGRGRFGDWVFAGRLVGVPVVGG